MKISALSGMPFAFCVLVPHKSPVTRTDASLEQHVFTQDVAAKAAVMLDATVRASCSCQQRIPPLSDLTQLEPKSAQGEKESSLREM